jgi:hypothetical protein
MATRSLVALLPIFLLLGCASEKQYPLVHPLSWQSDTFSIYSVLRLEPIPFPSISRYDHDPTAKGIYLHGFSLGWDEGLRASFPLRSTPFDVPAREDADKVWREGYSAGLTLGVQRENDYRRSKRP